MNMWYVYILIALIFSACGDTDSKLDHDVADGVFYLRSERAVEFEDKKIIYCGELGAQIPEALNQRTTAEVFTLGPVASAESASLGTPNKDGLISPVTFKGDNFKIESVSIGETYAVVAIQPDQFAPRLIEYVPSSKPEILAVLKAKDECLVALRDTYNQKIIPANSVSQENLAVLARNMLVEYIKPEGTPTEDKSWLYLSAAAITTVASVGTSGWTVFDLVRTANKNALAGAQLTRPGFLSWLKSFFRSLGSQRLKLGWLPLLASANFISGTATFYEVKDAIADSTVDENDPEDYFFSSPERFANLLLLDDDTLRLMIRKNPQVAIKTIQKDIEFRQLKDELKPGAPISVEALSE